MFVELHIIQNFAPSNLNRDDTNNPKDTEFGGVRRARISSQCIKRAIRTSPVFAATTQTEPAVRTRWLARLLIEQLAAAGKGEEEAGAIALAFATAYAGKADDKGRTSVLLYLGQDELQAFAGKLLDNWDALSASDEKARDALLAEAVKDLIKLTKDRTSAPDIALFGRMLADKPELNLDAACQVAHAISTHAVNMDIDFFTAVDDLQERDESGAGMMGYTGFNSAVFYRYSRLDWEQLLRNLQGDSDLARRAVEGFLRASVAAIPTGKQTTFAAQNPPSFLLAVVRGDGMSWSLTNAFERPVYARSGSGLVGPSIRALDQYWGGLERIYGNGAHAVAALSLDGDASLDCLAENVTPNLETWVHAVLDALPQEQPK